MTQSNQLSQELVAIQGLISSHRNEQGTLKLNQVKADLLLKRLTKLTSCVRDQENILGAVRMMNNGSVHANILGEELDQALAPEGENSDVIDMSDWLTKKAGHSDTGQGGAA